MQIARNISSPSLTIRWQNNIPLMKALAKLVTLNDPNLVLFVGEALVGNDGIDQLQMFNQVEVCSHVAKRFLLRGFGVSQALVDNSNVADPRKIDGIVLTKYDTVDDKVRSTGYQILPCSWFCCTPRWGLPCQWFTKLASRSCSWEPARSTTI